MEKSVKGLLLTKKKLRSVARHWQLYLLLILPLTYLIVFKYIPMAGLQIAFKDFSPKLGVWGSEWVGLKYFKKFFNSYQFTKVLKNTLVISFYSLVVGTPAPIVLALLINSAEVKWFKKAVQTITYIPHFISIVVLVGMINQIFNPISGVFGSIYKMFSSGEVPNILGIPKAFYHTYVWSGIWQEIGWSSIIYVAALSNVDPELHDAARVDGASRFKRMLYIDLPALIPTLVILLIMRCGSLMSVGYTKVLLMQNGFNMSYSEVISSYVYKMGLGSNGNYSFATAVSFFNSLVNFVLISIVNNISKKVGEESLW